MADALKDYIELLINSKLKSEKFIDLDRAQPYSGLNQRGLLWKDLLKHLHDKKDVYRERQPIQQGSLVDLLQSRIDIFDSENINKLENIFKNKNFWNPSINSLIEQMDDITAGNASFNVKNASFSVRDLLTGDAANSYEEGKQYVHRWENADNVSYGTVRDIDKIISVLTKSNHHQYTDEAIGKIKKTFLRLIMPEYLRRVEVEDLDRNFWAIAQFIDGLCGYLFSPDSPLKKILEQEADEIVQLWENILYLWVGLGVLYNKPKEKDRQVLFIPVNSDEVYSCYQYGRIDNINTNDAKRKAIRNSKGEIIEYEKLEDPKDEARNLLNKCIGRFQHIFCAYEDCDLYIIPEIRENNYESNHYSCAIYPGLIARIDGEIKTYVFEIKTQYVGTKIERCFPDLQKDGLIDGYEAMFIIDIYSKIQTLRSESYSQLPSKESNQIFYNCAISLTENEINLIKNQDKNKYDWKQGASERQFFTDFIFYLNSKLAEIFPKESIDKRRRAFIDFVKGLYGGSTATFIQNCYSNIKDEYLAAAVIISISDAVNASYLLSFYSDIYPQTELGFYNYCLNNFTEEDKYGGRDIKDINSFLPGFNESIVYSKFETPIRVNLEDKKTAYYNLLSGVQENQTSYDIITRFNERKDSLETKDGHTKELINGTYYCAVRPVVSKFLSNALQVEIDFQDIGRKLLGKTNSLFKFTISLPKEHLAEDDIKISISSLDFANDSNGNKMILNQKETINKTKGFYLGEVISSKYAPALEEFEPILTKYTIEHVSIGGLYPYEEMKKGNINKFKKITTKSCSSFDIPPYGYDIATYGYGSYYYLSDQEENKMSVTNGELVFVNYDALDNNEQSYTLNGRQLNRNTLDLLSINRVKTLKRKGQLGGEKTSGLYLTRFELNVWQGIHGSVWQNSMMYALVYYSGRIKKAQIIARPCLFNGYWVDDRENKWIWSNPESSQWRQLIMDCKYLNVELISNEKEDVIQTIDCQGGRWITADHYSNSINNKPTSSFIFDFDKTNDNWNFKFTSESWLEWNGSSDYNPKYMHPIFAWSNDYLLYNNNTSIPINGGSKYNFIDGTKGPQIQLSHGQDAYKKSQLIW